MSSFKDSNVFDDLVKTLTASIVNNYPRDVQLAVADAIPTARPNVKVGVSVLIQNEKGEFLVGERKGSHGAGNISFPPSDSCGILCMWWMKAWKRKGQGISEAARNAES